MESFDTDYCGISQAYFYINLFEPLNSSVVAKRSTKKLDVQLNGGLLNKLFNTRIRQNERILDAFIMLNGLKFDRDKTNDQEDEESNNSNEK